MMKLPKKKTGPNKKTRQGYKRKLKRVEEWNKKKEEWKILREPWDFKFITYYSKSRAFKEIIKRDGNRCWICNKRVPNKKEVIDTAEQEPTLDHVIPVFEGGCHCLANLKLAHRGCNEGRHKLKDSEMIIEELTEVVKIYKDVDEPKERFIHRLIMEIDKLPDNKFESLSVESKNFINQAIKSHNEKKKLPPLPDEKPVEAPKETKPYEPTEENKTIHILIDHNPKRKNSRAYREFLLYKEGMTMKEFIEAGGSRASIRWDVNKGFIELV